MINNNFDLVFTTNGGTLDTFNEGNTLRDITLNYLNYVIYYNDIEYPILGFTGSTDEVNGYINLVVEGDPFNDNTTTSKSRKTNFHIKPSKLKVDEYFNGLNTFEKNLLNRQTSPKYKSTYDYEYVGNDNVAYKTTKSLVWPVSDGYNIDYSTGEYVEFINQLIEIANNSDKISSDILTRHLVAESISNFDSLPKFDGTTEISSGQKMTKILKIYGRNFDEVKMWMDGLKSFNTVTYDKKNNTPDQLVKGLAKNLGWEMTTPISDNNLLSHYVETKQSTYSGQSTGLSSQEAEIEMWRRLIINSAWLFKSKGSRKSIEFFFKFLGIPKGLVDLNEYIYRAKKKIDMDLFYKILERFDLETDLTLYNVDYDGYPKFPEQTDNMFFQKSGLWYRQTSGVGTSEHILTGNNPHIGPYDGGQTYIHQLYNLIPNFTAFTITNEVKVIGNTNLFYNYNIGKFNSYTGKTYIDVLDSNNLDKTKYTKITTNIIQDPFPSYNETSCGCPTDVNDDILSVCIKGNYNKPEEIIKSCDSDIVKKEYIDNMFVPTPPGGGIGFKDVAFLYVYTKQMYDEKGKVIPDKTYDVFLRDKECCIRDGGEPYEYEQYVYEDIDGTSFGGDNNNYKAWLSKYYNTGYICAHKDTKTIDMKGAGPSHILTCQWKLPKTSLIKIPNEDVNGIRWYFDADTTLNDFTWKDDNGDRYLKFVTPKNSWGVRKPNSTSYLVGEPEYKYTNKSDSGFCPLNYTTPVKINDPVTNELGYACKFKNEYMVSNPNTRLRDYVNSKTNDEKIVLELNTFLFGVFNSQSVANDCFATAFSNSRK